MGEYLKTIIALVLCVSLITSLVPKDSIRKMSGFSIGLLMICAILLPILKPSYNFNIKFSKPDFQELTIEGENFVLNEFENALSLKLTEHLKRNTGKDFSARVYAQCDESGNISGVSFVEIFPYTKEYGAMCANYLGITQDKVVEK